MMNLYTLMFLSCRDVGVGYVYIFLRSYTTYLMLDISLFSSYTYVSNCYRVSSYDDERLLVSIDVRTGTLKETLISFIHTHILNDTKEYNCCIVLYILIYHSSLCYILSIYIHVSSH